MKSQKVETNSIFKNTSHVKIKKSSKLKKKFTEWFRNFLENSE
jgi:hypothetical protein